MGKVVMVYIVKAKLAPIKFLVMDIIKNNYLLGYINNRNINHYFLFKKNLTLWNAKIKKILKEFIDNYFIIKEKYFYFGKNYIIESFLEEALLAGFIYESSLDMEAKAILDLVFHVKEKVLLVNSKINIHAENYLNIKKDLADYYQIKIYSDNNILQKYKNSFHCSLIFSFVYQEKESKVIIKNKKDERVLFIQPLVIEKIFNRAYIKSQKLIRENLHAQRC